MKKISIGKYPYVYPIPTVLLGADIDGRPNYCTVGNCGIISVHPAVVYVSSDRSHYTNVGIKKSGKFSLNFPSTTLCQKADYCGLVSGRSVDKSTVFTTFYGDTKTAPMIEECPVNVACSVIQVVEIHKMEVFIADVVEAYANDDCLVDGKPNIKKIDPLIYSVKGNYWSIGNEIAKPFSIGKNYKAK